MINTSDIREKTISDLPQEMLNRIFSYLPLYSIKRVRLVCSEWNKSCNNRDVSENEKIVFSTLKNDDLSAVSKFLRIIYNLELQNFDFAAHHVSFWMKISSKLLSLTLNECRVDRNLPILQFCDNLNTLILDNCSPEIIHSFHRLDGNFIRTNIVSLTIKNCYSWSDETMDGVFRICPHLRSLTLNSLPINPFKLAENRFYSVKDKEDRVFNRSDILTYNCICYALETRAISMVELNLESLGNGGITDIILEKIGHIAGLKLRKIKLTNHFSLTEKAFSNFVTLQEDLQSITIINCSNILNANFIEKCSNLTSFILENPPYGGFVFKEKLLNALTNGIRLGELVLRGPTSAIDSYLMTSQRTFDYLHTLDLKIRAFNYNFILEKVTENLTNLTLTSFMEDRISSKTMRTIFSRFINLEKLKLESFGRSYARYFRKKSPDEIPLGNLKKLRILQIRDEFLTKPKMPICAQSSSWKFKFPVLRDLELHNIVECNVPLFINIMENTPLLERIVITDRDRSNMINTRDWKLLLGYPEKNFE